jgi:protoheme IX farnesyltransferase
VGERNLDLCNSGGRLHVAHSVAQHSTCAGEGLNVTTESIALQHHPARLRAVLVDYWALTKPEINLLIVIATSAGFCLAHRRSDPVPILLLIHTLLGTLLVASGAGTLNQYVERRFDAQMRRTARRPVASGRLKPSSALWFGIGLSVAGGIYLVVAVNALASLLAVLTLLSYLFVYTPLKRRTPLCVLAGAFPGAMPRLIGWAASAGSLRIGSWALFTVLFLWQFPHFMAIAWMPFISITM